MTPDLYVIYLIVAILAGCVTIAHGLFVLATVLKEPGRPELLANVANLARICSAFLLGVLMLLALVSVSLGFGFDRAFDQLVKFVVLAFVLHWYADWSRRS